MPEFIQALNDVFEAFGAVNCKRMFSGHGVYHDQVMFALVIDDSLYLKADEELAKQFQALGLPAFEYERQGKLVQLSYYLAPDEIYDDKEQAANWANKAYAVVLKAAKNKPKKKTRAKNK